MENNREYHIGRTDFDAFVHAVGSEIEQAQVRLIAAANAQMLFHYWKMGNYIIYHQQLHGWTLFSEDLPWQSDPGTYSRFLIPG